MGSNGMNEWMILREQWKRERYDDKENEYQTNESDGNKKINELKTATKCLKKERKGK